MHALNLYKTEAIDTLAWPVVENTITVKSSAMAVLNISQLLSLAELGEASHRIVE